MKQHVLLRCTPTFGKMAPRPENGIYIIQGEVNLVVTAMRRNSRWAAQGHQDEDQDPLLQNFSKLKDLLNFVSGKTLKIIIVYKHTTVETFIKIYLQYLFKHGL